MLHLARIKLLTSKSNHTSVKNTLPVDVLIATAAEEFAVEWQFLQQTVVELPSSLQTAAIEAQRWDLYSHEQTSMLQARQNWMVTSTTNWWPSAERVYWNVVGEYYALGGIYDVCFDSEVPPINREKVSK